MKTVKARFTRNTLVLKEPLDLPEGQEVEVQIKVPRHEEKGKKQSVFEWMLQNPIDANLPADLSHQHDHYLYGTPKKPPPKKKRRKT